MRIECPEISKRCRLKVEKVFIINSINVTDQASNTKIENWSLNLISKSLVIFTSSFIVVVLRP